MRGQQGTFRVLEKEDIRSDIEKFNRGDGSKVLKKTFLKFVQKITYLVANGFTDECMYVGMQDFEILVRRGKTQWEGWECGYHPISVPQLQACRQANVVEL